MRRVLITGSAGFLASHFIEGSLKETDWQIVGLDRLDETSTLARIGETDAYRANRDRFHFVWHDLRAAINAAVAREIGIVDAIVHLAASTHVDRSIADPGMCVADNVLGTFHMLEFARCHARHARFVYFSTDEVFGPAAPGEAFSEWSRYRSSNPYSATKAAGEELTLSYVNTYSLPAIITHMVNAFGERQHGEKFVPKAVRQILQGKVVKIHADSPRRQTASRYWIHARNAFSAVRFLLEQTVTSGEKFNIGSPDEVDCETMARFIAEDLDRPLFCERVAADVGRPGHDLRYSLDSSLLASRGWAPPVPFRESLRKCVRWMAANPRWIEL